METIRTLTALNTLRADRKMGLIAAGVAFFGMFSLFPGMAALIAVFGIVADPGIVQDQAVFLEDLMPPEAYRIVNGQLAALLSARPDTLGWASLVSLGVALWSARAAVAALIQGLNEIFRTPDRGGIWHIVVALLLTAGLIGVAMVALLLVVVAPIVLAFVPLGPFTSFALSVVRYGAALFLLLGALGILYRFGPNQRHARLRWVTPGAVLVVVCWLAASWGFSIYIQNFGNYNEVYGSIGAVVALLMWFYISAYLVLLGAGLNAVLARKKREARARRESEETERDEARAAAAGSASVDPQEA